MPSPHPTETCRSHPRLDAGGLHELETRWRALEADAGGSFFQSWTWLGCMAAERFPNPVLIEARRGPAVAGMALLNRRRRMAMPVLWFGESGDAALDAVFTEHNGPLVARSADAADTLDDVLRAALRGGSEIRLSGCGDAVLAAARRAGAGTVVDVLQTRDAPYVDLSNLYPGAAYLDTLSRNTRQQIRRSDRAYAADGPLDLARAGSVPEALAWFGDMVRLHEDTWRARGKPGAFAAPVVRRFHETLLRRGVPRGEVDVLRVRAGARVVGYLYNFVWQNEVSAYQSGFDYAGAGAVRKPGLTCHHMAIDWYRGTGAARYDFLGGASRYKTSFANGSRSLHWIGVAPRWHPGGVRMRLRRALGRA